MFDLSGKVAIVTGGVRGIGAGIAIRLAQAGADIASIHLPSDAEHAATTKAVIEAAGRRAFMHEGDVTDQACMHAFAEEVRERFGQIDIWVNNAAKLLIRSFLSMSDGEWEEILRTNLFGYYYGCREAIRIMMDQGRGGRIVNISSVTARQAISDFSAYITAKGGVVGLTKALAVEFAPHGIVINAVAPGATETPLTAESYTGVVRTAYERRIAVQRIGVPGDVAGAVLFLASEEARYVCGHELLVDGGLSLSGNVPFEEFGQIAAQPAPAVSS